MGVNFNVIGKYTKFRRNKKIFRHFFSFFLLIVHTRWASDVPEEAPGAPPNTINKNKTPNRGIITIQSTGYMANLNQLHELQQHILTLKQTAAPKLQIQRLQQEIDQLLYAIEGPMNT